MYTPIEALSPKVCERLEVYCDSCIALRARSVARICPGLSNAQVTSLFPNLYPSPGCQPMHAAFVDAYSEAIGDQFNVSAPDGTLPVV
jgi:hypothetical protein